jgi:hypothetical protein
MAVSLSSCASVPQGMQVELVNHHGQSASELYSIAPELTGQQNTVIQNRDKSITILAKGQETKGARGKR